MNGQPPPLGARPMGVTLKVVHVVLPLRWPEDRDLRTAVGTRVPHRT